MTERVVAQAIEFNDGSILDFSEMDPPEGGTVLVFGGQQESSGFTDPFEMEEAPDISFLVPAAPPILGLTTALSAEEEGSKVAATITATWEAPTLNTDESELTDLAGFNLSFSSDAGATWTMLQGSPTFSAEELTTILSGLQQGVSYQVRVYAVNYSGNSSDPTTQTITTAADTAPAQVTGVVLSAVTSAGVLGVVWSALTRLSLFGYEVQFQASTNTYPTAATFAAWATPSAANTIVVPLRPNALPSTQFVPADFTRWYKVRVRAVLFGGATGAWSSDSSAVNVDISITPEKLLDGTFTYSRTITLGYIDPTHKIVVTAGALSGYAGLDGGVESFRLDGNGLTLRNASLYMLNGVIRISDGAIDTDGLFIDRSGIKATLGGNTVVNLSTAGLTVGQPGYAQAVLSPTELSFKPYGSSSLLVSIGSTGSILAVSTTIRNTVLMEGSMSVTGTISLPDAGTTLGFYADPLNAGTLIPFAALKKIGNCVVIDFL
jgi:hypothetical protein